MTLLIIRGLPGSGKTTLAKTLTQSVFAADDYFMVDGRYEYDRTRIKLAHDQCFENVAKALAKGETLVAVTNVFQTKWQIVRYANLAAAYNYRIWVVDLFDQNFSDAELAQRNMHNVPLDEIVRMRRDWEH